MRFDERLDESLRVERERDWTPLFGGLHERLRIDHQDAATWRWGRGRTEEPKHCGDTGVREESCWKGNDRFHGVQCEQLLVCVTASGRQAGVGENNDCPPLRDFECIEGQQQPWHVALWQAGCR